MTRVRNDAALLRLSLVVVWLGTAIVSLIELDGQSRKLLVDSGFVSSRLIGLLVVGGALVDLVIGLALWWRPSRMSYLAALGTMALMTLTATVMQPALWLHPLGPLLKNLPIAALLWHLHRSAKC